MRGDSGNTLGTPSSLGNPLHPVSTHWQQSLDVLCSLALTPERSAKAGRYLTKLDADGRAEFIRLADSHHVVVRALGHISHNGAGSELSNWANIAVADEKARIANPLRVLSEICTELESKGCPVAVMKSLDHWPDLGNDLDLVTTAEEEQITAIMAKKFGAQLETRSWGDRLANKWNFSVPGMRELVEVHARRLGQTGEHTGLPDRFIRRRVPLTLSGYTFLVPAAEERIIAATLQRMYRHFYFRVCDILDTAALVDTGAIDYKELHRASEQAGIWPGVATFLSIVSDWIVWYRDRSLPLPLWVLSAARFRGNRVQAGGKYLRVPVLPHGVKLYGEQVIRTASRGDLPALFRLTLLPPLASAAALAFRITGSDKGVW